MNPVTGEHLEFVVFIIIPRRKVAGINSFSIPISMSECYGWKGQVKNFWALTYFEQTLALIFSLTQQTKPCWKLLLTYFRLVSTFYNLWKHQKTRDFSGVFRGYVRTIGLELVKNARIWWMLHWNCSKLTPPKNFVVNFRRIQYTSL